ncbi:MAG: DUF3298 domain-containing protein [Xanthobacteraceae bacterium]|nr:DUF3298 domain-containing protein [Xanthobacteraceae bacterium]
MTMMIQPAMPLRILIRASAVVALLGLSVPSLAEPAPAYAVKTKAVEVSVSIDERIKADTALAADLVAEGKRWADKNRRDAKGERRTYPELFRAGTPWSFDRRYATEAVVADRYVSVSRWDYTYAGGAHPNSEVDTILWDRQAGKRMSIRPFFNKLADGGPSLTAMRETIIAALKVEKKARGVDDDVATDWFKGIAPSLLKIGPVGLAPSTEARKSSGLVFHYSPYAVGPYAEGSYDAFVPWEALKPYLSAEGRAIFGGRRPETAKTQ